MNNPGKRSNIPIGLIRSPYRPTRGLELATKRRKTKSPRWLINSGKREALRKDRQKKIGSVRWKQWSRANKPWFISSSTRLRRLAFPGPHRRVPLHGATANATHLKPSPGEECQIPADGTEWAAPIKDEFQCYRSWISGSSAVSNR